MKKAIPVALAILLSGCVATPAYRPKDFGAGKNLHVYSVSGTELGIFATGSFSKCEKIAEDLDHGLFDMGEGDGQRIVCSNEQPQPYMNWMLWFADGSGSYALFMPNQAACAHVQNNLVRLKVQILNPCMPARESLKYHSVVMAPEWNRQTNGDGVG